jgi:7-carboxy-7-deazaguanine synthase
MSDSLVVNEIFLSLQGESTFAGLPCVFVRLTACDLRCSYCDSTHAFTEGRRQPLEHVLTAVHRLSTPFERQGALPLPLVEITGGEPLLQPACLVLMRQLCDDGFTVLLETNGAHDISAVDFRVRRIVDIKCPGSGESARNRWDNLTHLRQTDELKFVISTVEDYDWAREQITRRQLHRLCPILFSWAQPPTVPAGDQKPLPPSMKIMTRRELAERIIADALPVRFQAQLHKIIWPPDQRGV